MDRKNAIELEHLTKIFRTPGNRQGRQVLDDISFNLPRGATVAVTGANGSGKTTLLKILATLYLPDEGNCKILGMDLVREVHAIRERVAFVSPGLDFQRKLTLEENLNFFAKVQNSDPNGAYEFLQEMGMYDKLHDRTETFSEGQKAISRLAIGLMKDSDILFLDEITVGLDVQRREQVINYLNRFRNRKTMMIVDHNSSVIDRLCDMILILKEGGRMGKIIPISELMASLPYSYEITAVPTRYLTDREIKQLWPHYSRTGGTIRFYPKSRSEAQIINTRILTSGFINRAETRLIDLNDYAIRLAEDYVEF